MNLFKLLCLLVAVVSCSTSVFGDAILFQDDFNAGWDSAKWSAVGVVHSDPEPGCNLAISAGVLESRFDGAGAPQGAFARSIEIPLPSGWTSVVLTGQWAYPISVYGEMLVSLWPDGDRDSKSVAVSYYCWGGPAARTSYSVGGNTFQAPILSRSLPLNLTDFRLTVTPTQWLAEEKSGESWETLGVLSTDVMAGASSIQFQIGGWEYSQTGIQVVKYDNIQLTVIPEPASLGLLMLGGLGLLRRRTNG